MSKVVDRLKQLYELAKIRPDEEGDEARVNEARTASYLLIKTERENGVRIKFEVVREAARPEPSPFGHEGGWSKPSEAKHEAHGRRGAEPKQPPFSREDWQKFWQAIQDSGVAPPDVPSQAQAESWSYQQSSTGSYWKPGEVIDQQPSHPYASSGAYRGVHPDSAQPREYEVGPNGEGPVRRKAPPMCTHGTNPEACPTCFQERKGRPSGVRAKSSSGWDAAVDGVQFIRAKFSGVCAACGRSVAEGEMVWWKPGVGVTHGGCGNDVLRGVKEARR